MNDREILNHFKQVETRILGLTNLARVVFGLCCAERLLRVYERAAAHQAWSNFELLTRAVDAAWAWIERDGQIPPEVARDARAAVHSEDAVTDSSSVAAFDIANAIADFLEAAASGETKYAHYMAAREFDTLELLEDEHPEKATTWDRLQRNLIAQHDRELNTLAAALHPEREAPVLRAAARSVQILGSEWF